MFTLAGILLLMIGASLTFAVEREIEGVDLQLVGWIMMAGGLAALFVAIARFAAAMTSGARRRVDRSDTDHDGDAVQPVWHGDHAQDHGRDHGRDHRQTRVKRGRDDPGWAT